jgi:hypothetical protein
VKPSALKREHPALQKMKFISCFLFFWASFALLDLNPDLQYGSRDRTESGSNPDPDTDPDPQHCFSDPNPPKTLVKLPVFE